MNNSDNSSNTSIDEKIDLDDSDEYNTEDEKLKKIRESPRKKAVDKTKAAIKNKTIKKRKVSYNKLWEKKYNWLRKNSAADHAECMICICKFSVAHGGEFDVKKHLKSLKHKESVLSEGSSSSSKQLISTFMVGGSKLQSCIERDQIAASEVTFVYHTIKHGHSYNSADYGSNTFSLMFPDSIIAKKIYMW